ncbi:MAG TPA: STAS domain-containing protein [Solirubrobacteraceae bacterium]|nr:STAS domain-containing protein [Solirubrobacteraceae bacterium]
MSSAPDRLPELVAPDGIAACTVAELGTCVQITAGGELDLATLPLLQAAGDRAASPAGRTVVLDLCGVTFADTSVVHFAVGLDGRLRAHAGELIVVAPPRLAALFAHAGVDGLTLVEDAARSPS